MRFGIEIEAVGLSKDEVVTLLNGNGISCINAYRSTSPITWKVCEDGSIQGANGFELVSPPMEYSEENISKVKRVVELLNDAGVDVNASCGLHVHFEVAQLSSEHIANIFNRYRKFETSIDATQPASRRGSTNRYCRSLSGLSEIRALATPAETCAQVSDRYYKVNLSAFVKYGTVEFRQHSGTVNVAKVANWLRFLYQFIQASNPAQQITETVETIVETLNSSNASPIVRFLEGRGYEGATADEIATAVGMSRGSVQTTISRLRSQGVFIFSNGSKYACIAQRVEKQIITRTVCNGLPADDNVWRGVDASVKAYYARRVASLQGAA